MPAACKLLPPTDQQELRQTDTHLTDSVESLVSAHLHLDTGPEPLGLHHGYGAAEVSG